MKERTPEALNNLESRAQYVIVWEFRVKLEAETEFVEKYGPEGIWAEFFRSGQGYICTQLVRDVADRRRFLTLDYWRSELEFEKFREQRLAEYKKLDKECEQLTEAETCLGTLHARSEIQKLKS